MEISTIGSSGFRLKGKTSIVSVEKGIVAIGTEKPFKIDAPGEYEIQGISVIGINDSLGAKIFVVEIEGVRVAVLENMSAKLSDIQIDEMGSIDILLATSVPTDIASQIDPWVILTEKGSEGLVALPKYVVTSDKLPTETTNILLERKG